MLIAAPLAEFLGLDWLYWWQFPLLGVLVGLICFLFWYRRRQM